MLAAGTRLDRFEIRNLLGAGGMGEVYRARDSRLGREVALKLLPQSFLGNAERSHRFEREAQVLAALNHPNIAALYEVVPVPGSHALVMELVEGETLGERIARGALPASEALDIAVQIAGALEAAHEHGIVHRDLKPGNVKLRPDGTVKLLDFGLAKILGSAHMTGPLDVTMSVLHVPEGAIRHVLGSPACMSPEHARGEEVDQRTDVWAFGCLVFEMLSGVRPFAGHDVVEVIAGILQRQPDFSLLPQDLPAPVHRLLRRCLEKDRRRRLRDMGDARLDLLDVLDRRDELHSNTGGRLQHQGRSFSVVARRTRWLAASIAIIGAGVTWISWQAGATERARLPVTRFAITERGSVGSGVAISPDGNKVAYVTAQGLVVRALNELEGRVLVAANVVQGNPFFSPDGQWLGFKGWEALLKVPAAGGETTTLLDRIFPTGTWAGDDIYYGDTRGIFRIPATGGEPVQLLATKGVEQIGSVAVLLSREALLYTVSPTRGNVFPRTAAGLASARIEALDLRTGKSHVVLRGGGDPRITPTGHLLYIGGGALNAIGFDEKLLRTRGTPVAVLVTGGLLEYDVSSQGTLTYQVASAKQDMTLVWVNRQGQEQPLGAPPMPYLYPRISPDGRRVAIDVRDAGTNRDIWIWDQQRATLALFTKDPAGNPLLAWSRDGTQLAFGSERSGVSNVFRQAADGSGEPELMMASDALQMPVSYAPDGRLLVSVGVAGQQRDIYLMNLEGKRTAVPLIHGKANELNGEVSPDGRWVAYDSDESGQFEIYVRPFPEAYGGSRWQISSAGGKQPVWSRDGKELFYRSYSGAVVAVPVQMRPEFSPGRPATLFEGPYIGGSAGGGGRTYDVAPDGRFLMVKGEAAREATKLIVVVNWFEELRRLAPLP
jgi:eukaryotic-like serine/threonine-protein kinase